MKKRFLSILLSLMFILQLVPMSIPFAAEANYTPTTILKATYNEDGATISSTKYDTVTLEYKLVGKNLNGVQSVIFAYDSSVMSVYYDSSMKVPTSESLSNMANKYFTYESGEYEYSDENYNNWVFGAGSNYAQWKIKDNIVCVAISVNNSNMVSAKRDTTKGGSSSYSCDYSSENPETILSLKFVVTDKDKFNKNTSLYFPSVGQGNEFSTSNTAVLMTVEEGKATQYSYPTVANRTDGNVNFTVEPTIQWVENTNVKITDAILESIITKCTPIVGSVATTNVTESDYEISVSWKRTNNKNNSNYNNNVATNDKISSNYKYKATFTIKPKNDKKLNWAVTKSQFNNISITDSSYSDSQAIFTYEYGTAKTGIDSIDLSAFEPEIGKTVLTTSDKTQYSVAASWKKGESGVSSTEVIAPVTDYTASFTLIADSKSGYIFNLSPLPEGAKLSEYNTKLEFTKTYTTGKGVVSSVSINESLSVKHGDDVSTNLVITSASDLYNVAISSIQIDDSGWKDITTASTYNKSKSYRAKITATLKDETKYEFSSETANVTYVDITVDNAEITTIDKSDIETHYAPSYDTDLVTGNYTPSGKNYTVSVSWNPNDTKAGAGKTYTATFTVTANENYTLNLLTGTLDANNKFTKQYDTIIGTVTTIDKDAIKTAFAPIYGESLKTEYTTESINYTVTATWEKKNGSGYDTVTTPANAEAGAEYKATFTVAAKENYSLSLSSGTLDENNKFTNEYNVPKKSWTLTVADLTAPTLVSDKYSVSHGTQIGFGANVSTDKPYTVSAKVYVSENGNEPWDEVTSGGFVYGKHYKAIVTAAIKQGNTTDEFTENGNEITVNIDVTQVEIATFDVNALYTEIQPAYGVSLKTKDTISSTIDSGKVTLDSITWNPNNDVDYNTAYTATIVVKPANGYKFTTSTKVTNGKNSEQQDIDVTPAAENITESAINLTYEYTTPKEQISLSADDIKLNNNGTEVTDTAPICHGVEVSLISVQLSGNEKYEQESIEIRVKNAESKYEKTAFDYSDGTAFTAIIKLKIKDTYSSKAELVGASEGILTIEKDFTLAENTINNFDIAQIYQKATPYGSDTAFKTKDSFSDCTSSTTFTVSGLTWKKVVNNAESDPETAPDYGTTYRAYITFAPKTGYKFDNNTTVTNGKNNEQEFITVNKYGTSSATSITVVLEYTTAREVLTAVDESVITVNGSVCHTDSVGNVSFTVNVENAKYKIDTSKTEIQVKGKNDSDYSKYDGETFDISDGQVYRAAITLVAKDTTKATFAATEGDNDYIVVYPEITVNKKEISEIAVSFSAPSHGKLVSAANTENKPAVTTTGISVDSFEFRSNETTAMGESAAFNEGTTYYVYIKFTAAAGYSIATTGTKAVFGETKNDVTYSESVYSTLYSFTVQNRTDIESVAVTDIVKPVGDNDPKTTYTIGNDLPYSVTAVAWSGVTTTTWTSASKFGFGEQYKVTITLSAASTHKFKANDFTATINGETATVDSKSDDGLTISYIFTTANRQISQIPLAISNKFVTRNSQDTAFSSTNDNFTIQALWKNLYVDPVSEAENVKLKANTAYSDVKVVLTAGAGYEFDSAINNVNSFSSYTQTKDGFNVTGVNLDDTKKILTLTVNVGTTPEAKYEIIPAKVVYPYYNAGTEEPYKDGVPSTTTIKVKIAENALWVHDSVKLNIVEDYVDLTFNKESNTVAEYTLEGIQSIVGCGDLFRVFLNIDGTNDTSKSFAVERSKAPAITSVEVDEDESTVTSAGGDVTVTVSGTDFTYTDADGSTVKDNVKKVYGNVYKNGNAKPLNNAPIEATKNTNGTYSYTYTIAASTGGIDTYEFRAIIDDLTEDTTNTATVKQFVGGTIDLSSITTGNTEDKETTVTPASDIASGDVIEYFVNITEAFAINSVKLDNVAATYSYDKNTKVLKVTANKDIASGTGFTVKMNVTVGTVEVTSVTITNKTNILTVRKNFTLNVTVAPEEALDKTLTFSSSDKSVATVDANGKVVAKAKGITTIKATSSNGISDEFKLYVSDKSITTRVTGISFQSSEVTLNRYTVKKFNVNVSPSRASDKSVTWSSTDESIAYVDSDGYIHAVKNGTCEITATTNDGFYSATCKVTVKSLITQETVTNFVTKCVNAVNTIVDLITRFRK